jgi:hypothetical protein
MKYKKNNFSFPGSTLLSAISSFDFYHASQISDIHIFRSLHDDSLADMIVKLSYFSMTGQRWTITIFISQIRRAILPQFRPQAFLSELELHSVAGDQLEGIRYRFLDQGGDFLVESFGFEVLEIT